MDAHHVQHWVDGGATNLGNVVLLCTAHHRLVHEGGFRVQNVGDALRFVSPRGEDVSVVRVGSASAVSVPVLAGVRPVWDGIPVDYDRAVAALG
jgi:hypothetical protein